MESKITFAKKKKKIQHIKDESLVKLCSRLSVIDRSFSVSVNDKSSCSLLESELSERKINIILSGLYLLCSSDPLQSYFEGCVGDSVG